mmetsp:Transcript_4441/g.7159  ORF Transcript_4441/g.7159 Transcript_4441/m.7159 type:complete len:379 (+) Transcript_4441:124-1260(+)
MGLRSLDLTQNQISDAGCQAIALSLGASWESIHMNAIYDGDGELIAQQALIPRPKTLVDNELVHDFRFNSSLVSLRVDYCELDRFSPACLIGMIARNMGLRSLSLARAGLGRESRMLGKALQANTTLTSLDLTDNRIDYYGATEIAEALRPRPQQPFLYLKALSLPRNIIGDKGVKALARALRPSTGSANRGLGRQSSQRGDGSRPSSHGSNREDLMDFDDSTLPPYASLTALDLRDNGLGPRSMTEIAASLKVNRVLRKVILTHNKTHDDGAYALGRAMLYNTTLETLFFYDNSVGIQVAEEVSRMLNNSPLEEMDMIFQLGPEKEQQPDSSDDDDDQSRRASTDILNLGGLRAVSVEPSEYLGGGVLKASVLEETR